LGGLRLDPSNILNEAEFTKKTEEDSKEWVKSSKKNGGYRSIGQSARSDNWNGKYARYRDDDEPRIKLVGATKSIDVVTIAIEAAIDNGVVVEAIAVTNGAIIELADGIATDTTTTTAETRIGIVNADVEMTGMVLETGRQPMTGMIGDMIDTVTETSTTDVIRRTSTVVSVNRIVKATIMIAAVVAAGADLEARASPRGVTGSVNGSTAAAARTVGAAALAEATVEIVASTIELRIRRHHLPEVGDRTKRTSMDLLVPTGGTRSDRVSSKSVAPPNTFAIDRFCVVS
ncbi:Hypothetical protein PHPALM_5450, partial [Phytophthora palmivora]